MMTNLEAYMVYNPNEGEATLSLGRYSIEPTGTESNQISAALGMIDKALMSDYKQGSTSETVNAELRRVLLSRGKAILANNGVTYLEQGQNGCLIYSSGWK